MFIHAPASSWDLHLVMYLHLLSFSFLRVRMNTFSIWLFIIGLRCGWGDVCLLAGGSFSSESWGFDRFELRWFEGKEFVDSESGLDDWALDLDSDSDVLMNLPSGPRGRWLPCFRPRRIGRPWSQRLAGTYVFCVFWLGGSAWIPCTIGWLTGRKKLSHCYHVGVQQVLDSATSGCQNS